MRHKSLNVKVEISKFKLAREAGNAALKPLKSIQGVVLA